jgi:hypothetical protein
MDIYDAISGYALTGSMTPIHQFLAEHDAAVAARRAAETKVVVWLTATGAVAVSQPKTPAAAEDFAAALRAAGKAEVEVTDK